MGSTYQDSNPRDFPPDTTPSGGLANYYRNDVIGGPGAFVMAAENFNSFAKLTAPA